MRYLVECLTPVLVGDGDSLSPIDYMVWKDQVNVLDQHRIFKLLARGPRLDGYLNQVRKADKLDFASWGGFAQNYAGRRIPFEHSSSTAYWQKLRADHCHIPTFARGHQGAYLPASALRGALRTVFVASRLAEKGVTAAEGLLSGDKPARRPGEALEQKLFGSGRAGLDPLKTLVLSDSSPVPPERFRIYLSRTATLVEPKSPGGQPAMAWRMAPRGTVESRRADDSTPSFAEMAQPGTVFEGSWHERTHYLQSDVRRSLHWSEEFSTKALLAAANEYSGAVISQHQRYAQLAGLQVVARNLAGIAQRLEQVRQSGDSCLLALGWGTGMLPKAAWPRMEDEGFRRLLAQHPYYARAIRTGMPFPKTRKIVFQDNQPAALPGWVRLEVG
jgi:CRISPR-associated protein Csm5